MADNMDLQINITGTNDTGNIFAGFEESIKQFQASVESISKTFQSFSESVVSSMNMASSSARESAAGVEGVSSAMQKIEETSYVTRTALEEMFTSMQSGFKNASLAAMDAGQLTDSQLRNIVEAATGTRYQLVGGMQDSSNAVDQLGQALSAEMIGEQLKTIGETGLKVFEEASSAAADFEFNISRIGAVLTTSGKATSSQMQQMSDDALKIGSTSSFSANEVASGMYTLARQGLDATTILGDGVNGAINIVNDLAQATDSSMTDTATVITDVVHEYGLSGEQLREVANTMSGALHNSSESLDDFYQSMKQVGPVASAMHQNAMDMSTALALLAQHGITGSSAGTALKNMLLGLSPRTKAAAEDFAKLGISMKNGASNGFFDLQGNLKPLPDIINLLNEKFNGLSDAQKQAALSTVFTKYGLAGLNTVVGESRDKFMEFQNELKKDDAATIAAKKMDNLHGDLLKFNAGVQTMMKSFGDSINGMLRPLVQGASEAVKWITELPKPAKEAGMVVLGVASGLFVAFGNLMLFAGGVKMFGPSLAMAGMDVAKFEGLVKLLGIAFTDFILPIGLVVGAIAAVALGFTLAYKNIKPFHDFVNQVMHRLQAFGQMLVSTVLPVITNVFNSVSKVVTEAFSVVVNTIGQGLQTVYSWWMQYWPEIQTAFQNVMKVILTVLSPTIAIMTVTIAAGIGYIRGVWQNGWAAMGDYLKMIWDVIKGAVQAAWYIISGIISVALDLLSGNFRKAGQDFINIFVNCFNNLKSTFNSLISDAAAFGTNFAKAIASGISGAIGSVTSAVGSLVSQAKSAIGGGIQSAISSATSAISNIIPHASGGIFSTPHVGLVAEAGPEAIIPLSDPARGLQLWQQAGQMLGVLPRTSAMSAPSSGGYSGGGAVYNITVNATGNVARNEQQLADIISRGLLNKVKMQGKI